MTYIAQFITPVLSHLHNRFYILILEVILHYLKKKNYFALQYYY